MRRAFTLFELLLVLALLVILAGLALPSIDAMYADAKLTAAVDQVRAKWANARAHAIDEGRPYRFAVQPNGGAFRIAPESPEFWGGGGPSQPEGRGPLVLEDSLPNGVRFADSAAGAGPADPADAPAADASSGGDAAGWTSVAVFLPDGTARNDVEILFQARNANPQVLKLRGLTGGVTARTLQPGGGS